MIILEIVFAILSILALIGWYAWSVRRQLRVLTDNPAFGFSPESMVSLFGEPFSFFFGITPILIPLVIGAGVWLFGWRAGVMIAVGFPVIRFVFRPIARTHAQEMLRKIQANMEKEESDAR